MEDSNQDNKQQALVKEQTWRILIKITGNKLD
jgi:hypothetical protein